MKTQQTAQDRQWRTMEREIAALLKMLKKDICDDYRASDDPDDATPGMQVTVSTGDGSSWNYQTGDNSYTGGCYGDPHWLEQDKEEARERIAEIRSEIGELIAGIRESILAATVCNVMRQKIRSLRRESHKLYRKLEA